MIAEDTLELSSELEDRILALDVPLVGLKLDTDTPQLSESVLEQ